MEILNQLGYAFTLVPTGIWYLLTIIIGIIVSMFQYDRILLNKKRYEAWKEVWDIKNETFSGMIDELYTMTEVVLEIEELEHINTENPEEKDIRNLMGWIKLFEERDNEKFLPDDTQARLLKWALGIEKIDKKMFFNTHLGVKRYRRFKAHLSFFKLQHLRQKANLYINNGKMLAELSRISERVLKACDEGYGPTFVENFTSDFGPVMRAMKKELTNTVKSNDVNLTLEKSSLEVDEKKFKL